MKFPKKTIRHAYLQQKYDEKVAENNAKTTVKIEEETQISTEAQVAQLTDNMQYETEFVTDDDKRHGGLILSNKDYVDGNLKFVIQNINEEYRAEYAGKKFIIFLFAADKMVCKRCNRWMSAKLEWSKIVKETTVPEPFKLRKA